MEKSLSERNVFARLQRDSLVRQQLRSGIFTQEKPRLPIEKKPISAYFTVRSAQFQPRYAEINLCGLDTQQAKQEVPPSPKEPTLQSSSSVTSLASVREKILSDLSSRTRGPNIEALRAKVRSRFTTEHEEPPDFLDMGVVQRNAFWTQQRDKKVEELRKAKSARELDGCTFQPRLAKSRPSSLSNSMVSQRSSNSSRCSSYSELHKSKLRFRSTSYAVIHKKSNLVKA